MSGSGVKGSMKRTVRAPGFHIHSKFDLEGLRRHQDAKKKAVSEPNLPLTPMIDMMSILIIYLLMNFSATGEIFFISKDRLKIPDAAHGRPLESAALISVTQDKVFFDAEKMGDSGLEVQTTEDSMPILKSRLQQLRIMDETIHPGKPFKGLVNIQADQETPLLHVKRVMNVLISEGWTNINFAVQGGTAKGEEARELSSEEAAE